MDFTDEELEYLLMLLEDKCHSMRDWLLVSCNRSLQNKITEEQKRRKK